MLIRQTSVSTRFFVLILYTSKITESLLVLAATQMQTTEVILSKNSQSKSNSATDYLFPLSEFCFCCCVVFFVVFNLATGQ